MFDVWGQFVILTNNYHFHKNRDSVIRVFQKTMFCNSKILFFDFQKIDRNILVFKKPRSHQEEAEYKVQRHLRNATASFETIALAVVFP